MPPAIYSDRVIHLTSSYPTIAWDTTMTKCSFTLSPPINVPSEYFLSVSVISATIPSSWYAISRATPLQYILNNVLTNWITIRAGNWSATDIAAVLTNLYITVSYQEETNLFTFTPTTGNTIRLLASPILGVTLANTAVSANITNVLSGVSDIFPNISGTLYINVLSNLATQCVKGGSYPGGSGVLCSIPVSSISNGINVYQPSVLVRNFMTDNSITNLDITLCDDNMQPLNMNGSPWGMDILVQCIIPDAKEPTFNADPVTNLFRASRNK